MSLNRKPVDPSISLIDEMLAIPLDELTRSKGKALGGFIESIQRIGSLTPPNNSIVSYDTVLRSLKNSYTVPLPYLSKLRLQSGILIPDGLSSRSFALFNEGIGYFLGSGKDATVLTFSSTPSVAEVFKRGVQTSSEELSGSLSKLKGPLRVRILFTSSEEKKVRDAIMAARQEFLAVKRFSLNPRNGVLAPRSLVREPVMGTLNGRSTAVATKIQNESVFFIGPESEIELSDVEKEQLQINFIANNIVAVFLYSGRVTVFGEDSASTECAKAPEVSENEGSMPLETPDTETKRRSIVLQKQTYGLPQEGNTLGCTIEDIRIAGWQLDAKLLIEAFLRYAYRDCRVANPDDIPLQVEIVRSVDGKNVTFEVVTNYPFRNDITQIKAFNQAVRELLTSPPYKSRAKRSVFSVEVPLGSTKSEVPRRYFDWENRRCY